MQIDGNWDRIRRIFKKGMGNYAFATVNEDGTPRVTPIGSLILRDDRTGFFFEEYPGSMPDNLNRDKRVSIMAVDFRKPFWILSFLLGRYTHPPAVRLNGSVSERRDATPDEIAAFNNIIWVKLMRMLRFKGYEVGWKPLRHVRDVYFESFEPCNMGAMSRGHWDRRA